MRGEIQKVTAYITHGRRLLVFRHIDSPEAGIQVPGGTIEAGEKPESAVFREAYEETGLEELVAVRYLGTRKLDLAIYGIDGWELRHYFHLRCPRTPPSRWRYVEYFPSQGPKDTVEFELYWAHWPDEIPPLAGQQGALLAEIDWNSLPE